MTTRPCSILLPLLVIACGSRVPAPEPVPHPQPPADSRLAYVGTWQIEFALDSVRYPSAGSAGWIPARDTSRRIVGRLQVTDSVIGARALASTFEIDFAPLLGRPMSCFTSGVSSVQVAETHGLTSFWFTPNAYDCGFSGQAQTRGDTLAGTWEESSFVGPVASGRFWMRRN
jgi:hypothetical protein